MLCSVFVVSDVGPDDVYRLVGPDVGPDDVYRLRSGNWIIYACGLARWTVFHGCAVSAFSSKHMLHSTIYIYIR